MVICLFYRVIRDKSYSLEINACKETPTEVTQLEHVQLMVELSCSNISDLTINLSSPSGTKVGLLTKISVNNDSNFAYENLTWTFMTVQFWGEDPKGIWTVELPALENNMGKSFYAPLLPHRRTY